MTLDEDDISSSTDVTDPERQQRAAEYEQRMVRYEAVQELRKLRARELARRIHRREQSGAQGVIPDRKHLWELLEEPDEEVSYLIDQLWPVGGRVLFNAQFKAGKTTMRDNLIRSLVDGDDFLGAYPVQRVGCKRVAVIDTEMSQRVTARWLRDQAIQDDEGVTVWNLRGRLGCFDILDPDVRTRWAYELKYVGAKVVILDCLRPVLDVLGLDENTDAGKFLVAFDSLLDEADADEGMIVHHMGHNGERSRGSSRLRDWPDAEWKLVREQRDEDDPAAPRYFAAYGRDVDVPEQAIAFNSLSRRLTLTGTGSRKATQGRKAVPVVLALLAEHPEGLSGNQVEQKLAAEESQKAIREGLRAAVRDGSVVVEIGPRNANIHKLSSSVRLSSSPVRQRGQFEFVSSSKGDELNSNTEDVASSLPTKCIGCQRPTPHRSPVTWLCADCEVKERTA